MRKVILSVAPIARDNRNIDAKVVAKDMLDCIDAGATMMHLHPIRSDNTFDPEAKLFTEIVEKIKEDSDLIVQGSTGATGVPVSERYKILDNPHVQSCSFNSGTFNVGDNSYMINTLDDLRVLRDLTIERGIHCDFSLFEMGMIHNMQMLNEERPFLQPTVYSLVFGFHGCMPMDMRYFRAAVGLLPENALFAVTPDKRKDFSMIMAGLVMGAGLVRIGLEDSPYLTPEKKALTNAELVRRTVQIIHDCGCEVATLEETKEILQINK